MGRPRARRYLFADDDCARIDLEIVSNGRLHVVIGNEILYRDSHILDAGLYSIGIQDSVHFMVSIFCVGAHRLRNQKSFERVTIVFVSL